MNVVAYEMGKVSLAATRGEYYQQDINATKKQQTERNSKKEKEVIIKTPTVYEETRYEKEKGVKEKRSENSKTYKMDNGSYIQEIFFEPVHKKEGGTYVEIDNTLINTSKTRSTPIYEIKMEYMHFK